MSEPSVLRAYILHRYPYQETSLILKLFTVDQGLVGALARGAKRPKSPLYPVMNPFVPVMVELSGRGDLKQVRSITVEAGVLAEQHLALRHHHVKLSAAMYLNELLLSFLMSDMAYPRLFEAYEAALTGLVAGEMNLVLRQFEYWVLAEAGYAPDFSVDDQGHDIESEAYYLVYPGAAPIRCAELSADAGAIQGAYLLQIAAGDFALSETRRIAQGIFGQWILYYRDGKPIKSRELIIKN